MSVLKKITGDSKMLNVAKYLEEQLLPMGLIFILLLSIRNLAFIERIANNKGLKIIAYVVIAMYYLGILIHVCRMLFL